MPDVRLPDPLICNDGLPVEGVSAWVERRRAELLESFRIHEYGRSPSLPRRCSWSTLTVDRRALGGVATRKEVRVALTDDPQGPAFDLLLYVPNDVGRGHCAVPVFLGLNFFGNQTVSNDDGVRIARGWIPTNSVTRGRPPEALRGIQASSWPVECILASGYGLATAHCGEIVPDRADALTGGIHRWFRARGIGPTGPDAWGAISGWAWGLSRAMDYLCEDPDVDSRKVIVIGHSRLGKAALWGGAQDERFAIVISNNSGHGGAALAKRKFGERIKELNSVNPHWFCENFRQFDGREEELPIDQHELIALVAPRPVYIASAQMDLRADPAGEFLAAWFASPVYQLFGGCGLPSAGLPAADSPVFGTIGYHMRHGPHGITLFDWKQYIRFADRHLHAA